jgi:hypothetical protein
MNGRNITVAMFTQALSEVYNIEAAFATSLATDALSAVPHSAPNALDLSDLNKHDVIEHDASLTRNDAIQGDNYSVQPNLVQALLADAAGTGSDGVLTITSLSKSRVRREAESKKAGSPALSSKMATLAYGESALLLQVLGHLGKAAGAEHAVPKAAAQRWLLEEQLPEGWTKPQQVISKTSTGTLAAKVLAARTVTSAGGAVAGALEGAAAALGSLVTGGGGKGAAKNWVDGARFH